MLCPKLDNCNVLQSTGPVYKLAFGPRSFIVVSDPVMAKHILKSGVTDYDKGVLASVRKNKQQIVDGLNSTGF